MRLFYFCVLSFFIFLSTVANATCVRHIYNKSARPWTFKAIPLNNGENIGNVWFENIKCLNPKNGPCTIPPNAVAAIKYTTTDGRASGIMPIQTSAGGVGRTASYDGFGCPSVRRDPALAPAIQINVPADGDFVILKNSW